MDHLTQQTLNLTSSHRNKIYEAIDKEREYQLAKHGALGGSSRPAEYANDIEHHLDLLKACIYHGNLEETQAEFRKIAALCVAEMEQNGVVPR